MSNKYDSLFEPITLGNGVESKNRFAMAPMLVFASTKMVLLVRKILIILSYNDTGG